MTEKKSEDYGFIVTVIIAVGAISSLLLLCIYLYFAGRISSDLVVILYSVVALVVLTLSLSYRLQLYKR